MTERTEARLRAAMRDEVEGIEVSPDAWASVQRRTVSARRRAVVRRSALVGAAAVAAILVGVGVLRSGDDTTVEVTPAATTSTTAPDPAASTSPSTTSTTVAVVPGFEGFWPFASQADVDAYLADPGVGLFRDPEQTALEFAREYLGMPDPVALDGYVPAEGASGSVTVVPSPGAPMRTTIWVHAYDGVHTVYFAEATNIRPASEAHGVTVDGSTVRVRGTSTSYEAHVDLEVRDAAGTVLGRTYVMGGANGEYLPYDGTVEIDTPTTPTGAVILSTSSAEDGSLSEATVIPVAFEQRAFSVWFHRGEELVEVRRTGPRTPGVLRQALDALVAGPTADERAAGLGSFFSEDTADLLAGVTVRDGTAIIDLAHEVDNASTSAGSGAFLDELNGTVLQFPTVERVEYRLRGSCEAFWTWLQFGECRLVDRRDN